MTKTQLYIIIIIIVLATLCWVGLSGEKHQSTNLAGAIGDPLELVVVNNNNYLYSTVKKIIDIEIGPSPQPEKLLSIMEVDSEKFTGILRRHQNLLFVEQSDTFNIQFKYNLFAENQLVILLQAPSVEVLKNKENEILNIVKKIKNVEIERLVKKFKKHANKILSSQIKELHGFNIHLPKDFFVAHKDSNTTWVRRETPKISQGLLIVNLDFFSDEHFSKLEYLEPDTAIRDYSYFLNGACDVIDSIISKHVLGPVPNSYMVLDRLAPMHIQDFNWKINFSYFEGIKMQSLWRMENDFMGGIYQAYFLRSEGLVIYNYLYAPGEKKSIPLLQLEALLQSIH